jgi:hypothetical protein
MRKSSSQVANCPYAPWIEFCMRVPSSSSSLPVAAAADDHGEPEQVERHLDVGELADAHHVVDRIAEQVLHPRLVAVCELGELLHDHVRVG